MIGASGPGRNRIQNFKSQISNLKWLRAKDRSKSINGEGGVHDGIRNSTELNPMRSEELLIILLVGGVLLLVPLIAIVLSIVAILKTRRLAELTARLNGIETYLRNAANGIAVQPPRHAETSLKNAATADSLKPEPASSETVSASPVGWETFIGQKAFGWVAVILFLFSATFFLRYAYQNNWIGPVGRVAIGEMVGPGPVIAGCRYLLNG